MNWAEKVGFQPFPATLSFRQQPPQLSRIDRLVDDYDAGIAARKALGPEAGAMSAFHPLRS